MHARFYGRRKRLLAFPLLVFDLGPFPTVEFVARGTEGPRRKSTPEKSQGLAGAHGGQTADRQSCMASLSAFAT